VPLIDDIDGTAKMVRGMNEANIKNITRKTN